MTLLAEQCAARAYACMSARAACACGMSAQSGLAQSLLARAHARTRLRAHMLLLPYARARASAY
eukprot:11562772-Alexandrium_andersonii.AAC.1